MENVVGIDLGGTYIKGGRIEGGCIVKQVEADTLASIGGTTTIDVTKQVIASLITDDTTAIGIGVPSIVDRIKGIVYNVQNIVGWDEVPIKSIIEAEFGIPVYIDNDANCFAYGEKIYGKGKIYSDFVGVTLGTGVGAGIIHDNHLFSDTNCGSGEFGEIPYLNSKLEDFCGSCFFKNSSFLSGYEVATYAREGDQKALLCLEEYGKHLAHLVKIIVLVLDPQAIIFGGSISKSFDLFRDSINHNLVNFPYPRSIEKLAILSSEQQNIGILGAGTLCINNNRIYL